MDKITQQQAEKIVRQIAEHAVGAYQLDEALDVELLATRVLYQLEHPELISDDK